MHTPNDVAEMLSVSVQSVYNMIHDGRLRAIDLKTGKGRSCYRIPLSAIDAFLNEAQRSVTERPKVQPVHEKPKERVSRRRRKSRRRTQAARII